MSCGKRCAQAGHASIGAYNGADKNLQKSWLQEGQKKVVLKANDERTLFELKVIAERAGISTSLIQDAGIGMLLHEELRILIHPDLQISEQISDLGIELHREKFVQPHLAYIGTADPENAVGEPA